MSCSVRRESVVAQGCRGGAAGRLGPMAAVGAAAAVAAAMVAAAVAAAMEVNRERPEVRILGLHACR